MAKLAVFRGHGGVDTGAVANGHVEREMTKELMLAVVEKLQKAGHNVHYNVTDNCIKVNDKIEYANERKFDGIIELHFNSFVNASANGSEVWYYKGGGKSQILAQAIQDKLVSLGFANRGIKPDTTNAYGIINRTKDPAVLVETCFLSSPMDMELYNVQTAADAIAEGICVVYGGEIQTVRTYTVQSGDSFWKIADEQLGNGNRYKELASFNDMKSTDTIFAGQILKLPN